ncbi:hypothetical protein D9M69_691490 [compost metagenome]
MAVVQHQGTQLLANGSSAGFACPQHREALGFEGVEEPGGLRGLARSVPAFERDEKTWALDTHPSSLPSFPDIKMRNAFHPQGSAAVP